jgi:hypothetical protein
MRRQRQEPRLLLHQHVGDGPIALLGMRTLVRALVAPAPKLRIQVLDIEKRARRKEGVSQVLDLALDLALGESCQLRLMRMLRIKSSGSPIRFTH